MTELLYAASKWILALTSLLVLVRGWRGPSIVDRVLAVDTLALVVAGYLLLEASGRTGRFYTDAALGVALFGFLGTALMAHFLRGEEFPDE